MLQKQHEMNVTRATPTVAVVAHALARVDVAAAIDANAVETDGVAFN
jgi:hypothetical protein